MPAPLWRGSLSFGLVNVPVTLVPATRDVGVHFNQVHVTDGSPIEVQRWCTEEDVEVPFEELTRAYELPDGRQVMIDDEELEAIAPERTRTIAIEQFVDVAEVDPLYFSHAYFLEPADDDASLRAYRLLTEVMGQTGRAALGRFVMRTKEYLALVRERGGVLALETMRFPDEIRDDEDVDAGEETKATSGQLKAALTMIDELSADWEPKRFEDNHRARLLELIETKLDERSKRSRKQPAAPSKSRSVGG